MVKPYFSRFRGSKIDPIQNPSKMGQKSIQNATKQQRAQICKMCTAPRRELNFQWFRGPNLAPKMIKNICKNRSAADRPLEWALDGSWDEFWTILGAKMGSNLAPKFIKNRLQNRSRTDRPLGWILDGSGDGFWTIFGASWGPRWGPTGRKIRSQSQK